jgi:cob(I)alamin adenosyltransferase
MTNSPEKPDPDARHAVKMAKKKAARDKIMAGKTGEKGLIIVHTGKGKGKSTAAFGMIFRCIAHGMPCAVVQFIKGGMSTGERDLILRSYGDICQFHTMGEGFTWETQDRSRDIEMAQAARANRRTCCSRRSRARSRSRRRAPRTRKRCRRPASSRGS